MSSPYLHPTAIALGMLIVAMLGGSIVQFMFLRGLRKHHPRQWEHAGQPTMWTDQSLFSAWPTVRYIQRRDFHASGDGAGVAFCQRYRAPLLLGYWATVAAFVLVGILLFTVGIPPEWV